MDGNAKAAKEAVGNTEEIGGLDRIREIIVGEHVRAIQAELKDLQKQIDALRSTLGSFRDEADAFNENFQQSTSKEIEKAKHSAEEQKKNIEDSMANMMKTIKAQLKKLEETKVDKSKIGQVFMEWGQKMNELQS